MALLVNGERIEDAALREEERAVRRLLLERLPGESRATIDQRAREWSRENLIERALLRQAALRDPAPIANEAIEEALKAVPLETRENVEVRLRMGRFVANLTSHVGRPRHKDIVEHYRKNRDA